MEDINFKDKLDQSEREELSDFIDEIVAYLTVQEYYMKKFKKFFEKQGRILKSDEDN